MNISTIADSSFIFFLSLSALPLSMILEALNRMVGGHGSVMEMTCVLKVNPQCPACKWRLNQVLQCTKGQFSSLTMDGEAHKVKITGPVDTRQLMQVLSTESDGHGEVALIQLNNTSETYSENYYRNDHHYMTNYGNTYYHQPQDDRYVYNGYYQPADHGYYQYQYPYPYPYRSRCLCNIM